MNLLLKIRVSYPCQPILDSFSSAASSPYGCILVHNRVALATERWWALPPLEQTLLLLLVAALPHASARDLPVFLPIGSPKIAHRLLTFHLMTGALYTMLHSV